MSTVVNNQDRISDQNSSDSSQSITHPLKANEPKNQILVLNGVRALACLIVLTFHLHLLARKYGIWPPLPKDGKITAFFVIATYLGDFFNNSGIIIFFMLSSFLLFLPYAKWLLFDSPRPSLRHFYLRRIFRILPGYFFALFFTALFFQPIFLRPNHWHDLWPFLTFTMSFNLSGKFNIPFWTLAIEFQFYLLLPILAWFFSLIVRRGSVGWRMAKLTFCLLMMTAWGLLTRYWGLFLADTSKLDFLIPHSVSVTLKPYLYSDTGKFFEVFAVGMLICMVYTYTQNSPQGEHWKVSMRRLGWPMFIISLLLLFFMSIIHFYEDDIATHYQDYHLIIKTSFNMYAPIIIASWSEWGSLVYAIAYSFSFWALLYGPARLKRPFESSILNRVASISFSLYMWHYLLMSLFVYAINYNIRRQGWNALVQYGAFWCWTLVIIFPVATMLYRWIEQPAMQLGDRLIRKLGL